MNTLLAYLQLCRFAAVFTAAADIFLGFLLVHDGLEPRSEFVLLLLASSSLYLAGMVFNDVFDRAVDAKERPRRPIPSGRVSLRAAVAFGSLLLATGLGAAAAAGTQPAIVAAVLTSCIFLYDGMLKSTLVGPVAMGSCRFLNVILGASTALSTETGESSLAAVWALPQLFVAAALGAYIVGVTWFARREATASSRAQLAAAAGVVNLGLALLIAFTLNWPDALGRGGTAALMLVLVGAILNRRLLAAVFNPAPAKVQAAVKTMLLSLIMFDASLVFFVEPDRNLAIAVALLLIPANLLGRALAIT